MKKSLTTLFLILMISICSFAQNGWVQESNYPGSGSIGNTGFSFLSEGLAGMGYYGSSSNCFVDFWAYQPMSNTWIQRANFLGGTRYEQKGFTIGKFGYVCMGSNGVSYYNDLWEFDEDANTWSQKANYPGTSRYGEVAFGGATTAYVGLGQHQTSGCISDYFTDFYEYSQATNTWTQKATFAGQGRYWAFYFAVNGKFYVVCGRSVNSYCNWIYLNDMWAYDPSSNSWTQKTSYPGNACKGQGGFVLGQYAYMGLGFDGTTYYNDFWQYDPVNDTWLSLPLFPGGVRTEPFCFSVNGSGYLGCGAGSGTSYYDLWKYDLPVGLSENTLASTIKLYPVPANDKVYLEGANISKVVINTANGSFVKEIEPPMILTKCTIDVSDLAPGFYCAKIFAGKDIVIKKVIVN